MTVSDPTLKKTGFELTARVDSSPVNDAGTLAFMDGNTQVVTCATSVSGGFYPGSCGNSLHWIEQTLMAFLNGVTTYTINWTPPASDIGTVTLYAAGNAGNGDTSQPLGTHVYLTKLQLSPAAALAPPTITAINPNDSSATSIQPGSWIWIKGTNLAAAAATLWSGNFPTSLAGATVTINNKSGYLYYASPNQINLQAPDDTATGPVNVTVMTSGGSATATVTLAPYSPAWSLLDATHVAGIILRNGNGAYGGGTYDIIGPTGSSLGYGTVAAKAGDIVELYGIGFGPTTPPVPAGQAFSGAAPLTAAAGLQLTIAGTPVTPSFAGLTSAGLYQFNVTIPAGLPAGDQPLNAAVGGVTTQSGVVISLQ